jgi:hypothetical protein
MIRGVTRDTSRYLGQGNKTRGAPISVVGRVKYDDLQVHPNNEWEETSRAAKLCRVAKLHDE